MWKGCKNRCTFHANDIERLTGQSDSCSSGAGWFRTGTALRWPGEAQLQRGVGGDMDAAEREIRRFPHLHARAIGGEDRAANLIGPHEVECAAVDHADRHTGQPDVLP